MYKRLCLLVTSLAVLLMLAFTGTALAYLYEPYAPGSTSIMGMKASITTPSAAQAAKIKQGTSTIKALIETKANGIYPGLQVGWKYQRGWASPISFISRPSTSAESVIYGPTREILYSPQAWGQARTYEISWAGNDYAGVSYFYLKIQDVPRATVQPSFPALVGFNWNKQIWYIGARHSNYYDPYYATFSNVTTVHPGPAFGYDTFFVDRTIDTSPSIYTRLSYSPCSFVIKYGF